MVIRRREVIKVSHEFTLINIRLFKKERIEPGKSSQLYIENNQEIPTLLNQLELTFTKESKENFYRYNQLFLSNWNHYLPDYQIILAFDTLSDKDYPVLCVTFSIKELLTSMEMEMLFDTIKYMVGESTLGINQNVPTQAKVLTEVEEQVVSDDDQHMMELLRQQVKEQQNTIIELENRVLKQNVMLERSTENNSTEHIKISNQLFALENENSELYERLKQMTKDSVELDEYKESVKEAQKIITHFETKVESEKNKRRKQARYFKKRLEYSDLLNQQLDRANRQLSDRLKEFQSHPDNHKKVKELEQALAINQQENLDLTQQVNEYKVTIEQLSQTNERLTQNIEQMKEYHDEGITNKNKDITDRQAVLQEQMAQLQKDYTTLRETLENERSQSKEMVGEYSSQAQNYVEQQEELVAAKNQIVLLEEKLQVSQEHYQMQVNQFKMAFSQLQTDNKRLNKDSQLYQEEMNDLTQEMDELNQELKDLQAFIIDILEYNMSKTDTESKEEEKEISGMIEAKEMLDAQHLISHMYQQEEETSFETREPAYDDDDLYYEKDPYVMQVEQTELFSSGYNHQKEDEADIEGLFQASDTAESVNVKMEITSYKQSHTELKFLEYRWQQVRAVHKDKANVVFLDWCEPYISDVNDFLDELQDVVKHPIFSKKYVQLPKDAKLRLKAYSALSVYLETYCLKASSNKKQYF